MTNGELESGYSLECFVAATRAVGELHKPIRLMVRGTMPDNFGLGDDQFSGWVFMTDEDTPDDASDTVGFYWLKNTIAHNPEIVDYLVTPPPCRFERDEDLPLFIEVPPGEWD